MSCPLDTREELLVAYSSRQLDAAQTVTLELHFQVCRVCREFVAQQQAVWEALDLWEPAPVSQDFKRLVHQRMEQRVSFWTGLSHSVRPLFLHRSIPLVAAAGLLFAAGLLLNPSVTPPRATVGFMSQAEPLQPEQVVNALDELDAINQFDHLMKPDSSESDSKM